MPDIETIIKPGFKRVDKRGTLLEILNEGQWESVLCGEMKSQAVMGNHYHKHTDVFFFLTNGLAQVTSVDTKTSIREQHLLNRQEGILLKATVAHAILFIEDSSFIMMKSKRYNASQPDTFHFPVQGKD